MLLKIFGIEDLDGGWIFNGSFSYTLSTIIIGQIRGLQICRLLYEFYRSWMMQLFESWIKVDSF